MAATPYMSTYWRTAEHARGLCLKSIETCDGSASRPHIRRRSRLHSGLLLRQKPFTTVGPKRVQECKPSFSRLILEASLLVLG